jgi:hypothetical protein
MSADAPSADASNFRTFGLEADQYELTDRTSSRKHFTPLALTARKVHSWSWTAALLGFFDGGIYLHYLSIVIRNQLLLGRTFRITFSGLLRDSHEFLDVWIEMRGRELLENTVCVYQHKEHAEQPIHGARWREPGWRTQPARWCRL